MTVLTVRVVNRCQAEFSSMESRQWLTLATVIGQYFAPLAFTTVSYVSIMIRLRSRSDGLGNYCDYATRPTNYVLMIVELFTEMRNLNVFLFHFLRLDDAASSCCPISCKEENN